MKKPLLLLPVLLLLVFAVLAKDTQAHHPTTDLYDDWGELLFDSQNVQEGRDYRIQYKMPSSFSNDNTVIMAIHGGGIEAGTSELAADIAGSSYDYYMFEGLRTTGNSDLHITATHFDEPIALEVAAKATSLVSLHGAVSDPSGDPIVWIGGKDQVSQPPGEEDQAGGLADAIKDALVAAGFDARMAPSSSPYAGRDPFNICNRNTRGAGVQLELTQDIRNLLFVDGNRAAPLQPAYDNFVNAVRTALQSYEHSRFDAPFVYDPLYSVDLWDGGAFAIDPATSYMTVALGVNTGIYADWFSGVILGFYDVNDGSHVASKTLYPGTTARSAWFKLDFLPYGTYFITASPKNSSYASTTYFTGTVHNNRNIF